MLAVVHNTRFMVVVHDLDMYGIHHPGTTYHVCHFKLRVQG